MFKWRWEDKTTNRVLSPGMVHEANWKPSTEKNPPNILTNGHYRTVKAANFKDDSDILGASCQHVSLIVTNECLSIPHNEPTDVVLFV